MGNKCARNRKEPRCARPFVCLWNRRGGLEKSFTSYDFIDRNFAPPPSYPMVTNHSSAQNLCDKSSLKSSRVYENIDEYLPLNVNEDLLNIEGDGVIKNFVGWTALTAACHFGDEELVRRLLDSGENIGVTDEAGWSPLMVALNKRHFTCAELLLTHGADVTQVNKLGWSALMMAAYALTFEGGKCNSSGGRQTSSDAVMLELLLEHGADPNHSSSNGLTALMIAAKKGRFDAVEILISFQVNTDHEAEGGLNALILATLFADLRTIQTLLRNGASVNNCTTNGVTSLLLAVETREYEIIKLLVDEGADICPSHNIYLNPIIMAAKHGRSIIIDMLIGSEIRGSDEGDRNQVLFNALFIASKNGHFDTVDVLIRHGVVNINSMNSIGLTPLMLASENGHLSTVKLLLRYGANVSAVNSEGELAVDRAHDNGHKDIVQLLKKYGSTATPQGGKETAKATCSNDVGSYYLAVNNPSDTGSVSTSNSTIPHFNMLLEDDTLSEYYSISPSDLDMYMNNPKGKYLSHGKATR